MLILLRALGLERDVIGDLPGMRQDEEQQQRANRQWQQENQRDNQTWRLQKLAVLGCRR
jgi:hypothetical protein